MSDAARFPPGALFDLDGPLLRVGALPAPVPYSPPLEAAMLPGQDRIEAAIRKVLESDHYQTV